jgi:hypothetical protein
MVDRIVCCIVLLSLLLSKAGSVSAQCSPAVINSQHRTAPVIGVGNYTRAPKLVNPANDARDISASLDLLHFHPKKYIDDKAKDLRKHIEDWTNSIPRNCDIALFYFAGHAIQGRINKENYLFPSDGTDISDELLEGTAYKVSDILNRMKASGAKLNILILDACRLPPEPRAPKNSIFHKGLAAMNPTGNGTLICFSTEAGKASSDGPPNGHSEYTQALLEYLEVPGLPILKMLERVHDRVFADNGLDQNPCIYSSVGEDFDFCLSPAENAIPTTTNTGTTTIHEYQQSKDQSPSAEMDRLYKKAVDSFQEHAEVAREDVRRSLGPDISSTNGGYKLDIDNYTFYNHLALSYASSDIHLVVLKIAMSLEGINLKIKISSDNKSWLESSKPDLLARHESLHNLPSEYEKNYSIYAPRWSEIDTLIRTYYLQRVRVLQKNGVPEPPKPISEKDTFATKQISAFRSASDNPSKRKEQKERKIFDSLYETLKAVATGIKDSLGKDFVYHEDDIQKNYQEHTFYYGVGIRSVDIPDKWLVPIISGGIRNDSLYMQIATYANPPLSAWEKNNDMPHDEKMEAALSDLNWDDLGRQTRKFIVARLEILK